MIGLFFERRRAIAFALATVGASVANISFPWISTFLINFYGWRGSLMLSSGIIAQICVAAMFLRSPPNIEENTQSSNTKEARQAQSFVNETKVIFRKRNLVLHFLSNFALLFTISVVYTHIVAYAKSEGATSAWRNLILTTIGAATIGRYR